jgi:2-oxoglutarate dehydrogenase E1 component
MRDVRKPLVVFTPKSYLRRPESRSNVDELTRGSFEEVVDDPGVTDRAAVTRVVLCSGKVAFDAMADRTKRAVPAAIVRVEQLFPFPQQPVVDVLRTYPNAREVVWLQEEPANMGPSFFVEHHTHGLVELGYEIRHVARVESGSPATGSAKIHEQELADLMDDTFAGH